MIDSQTSVSSQIVEQRSIAALRWPSSKQLSASLLSVLILSLALGTLWLGQWLTAQTDEKVEIRQLALMVPPPPPPPPPAVQQQLVETPISLQVPGAGPSIQMAKIEQRIDPVKPDMPAIDTSKTQWQSLEIDWNAFDLNDLDGLPALLTPLRVTLPKSLTRRGIKRVLVKLDIVIDEQGQINLINIVENPHPELISEIKRLVRDSRFTAPQKDNQPVRARFIWPVDIAA